MFPLPLTNSSTLQEYRTKDDFKDIKKCCGATSNMEIPKAKEPETGLTGIEKLLADGVIKEQMLTPQTKLDMHNRKWKRKSAGLTTRLVEFLIFL